MENQQPQPQAAMGGAPRGMMAQKLAPGGGMFQPQQQTAPMMSIQARVSHYEPGRAACKMKLFLDGWLSAPLLFLV